MLFIGLLIISIFFLFYRETQFYGIIALVALLYFYPISMIILLVLAGIIAFFHSY